MRLLKTHPILGLVNSYMVDSPQPASISYMWNFGSLLGACLVIQIITGITLAMHYTPNIDLAFVSVEHIQTKCALKTLPYAGTSTPPAPLGKLPGLYPE
jgi:quinol-cytochrome oxidoreductase complex cytochrome b subunit